MAASEGLHCRFYEKQYPDIDEAVLVKVRSVAEMGAYVSLLEYNNIEGMILLSELSRRRIRSIPKLIRVGRNEVVVVLRVDKEKGTALMPAMREPRSLVRKPSPGRVAALAAHACTRSLSG